MDLFADVNANYVASEKAAIEGDREALNELK